MKLKILICSHTQIFAEGLCRLLEEDDDIEPIGIACSDADISQLMQRNPEVIVSDIDSLGTVLNLQRNKKDKNVLLVNGDNISNTRLMAMISDGLGGFLPMDADQEQLIKAVKKIHTGELWFDRHTMYEFLSDKKDTKPGVDLTKRELEILKYICKGMSNKEIAQKLFVSEQTVKSHCNHLFKKFGVSSRLKLAIKAPRVLPGSFQMNQIQ